MDSMFTVLKQPRNKNLTSSFNASTIFGNRETNMVLVEFMQSTWLSMLQQPLSPIKDDAGSTEHRALWLDPVVVVSLKGSAILASQCVRQVCEVGRTRAYRLVSPLPPAVALLTPKDGRGHSDTTSLYSTTSTQHIQLLVANALANSLSLPMLQLNATTLKMVRKAVNSKCRELYVPTVSDELLVQTLFNAIRGSPLMILLSDSLTWYEQHPEVTALITQETRAINSSLFFVMAAADDPAVYTVPAAVAEDSNRDDADLITQARQLDFMKSIILSPSAVNRPPGVGSMDKSSLDPSLSLLPAMTMVPPPAFRIPLNNGSHYVVRPMSMLKRTGNSNNMSSGPMGTQPAKTARLFHKNAVPWKKKSSTSGALGDVNMKSMRDNWTNPFVETGVNDSTQHTDKLGDSSRREQDDDSTDAVDIDIDEVLNTLAEMTASSRTSARVTELQGPTVLDHFTDVELTGPIDPSLRLLWNDIVKEDLNRIMATKNLAALSMNIATRNFTCPACSGASTSASLRDILSNQILTCAQVSHIVTLAWKIEVSRQASRGSGMYGGSVEGGDRSAKVVSKPLEQLASVRDNQQEVSVEEREGRNICHISAWSLEASVGTVLPTQSPKLLRPLMSLTSVEMDELCLDKYEKALLSNVVSPQSIGMTFDNIGGLEGMKDSLKQCITYPLKYPSLYQNGLAAEAVKGVLLFGPPGTGKTMLAKAVATEGGATFISVDTSVIESKWLGESEKNARAVFTLARKLAPCVVFFDEVDSILSSRELASQGEDSSTGGAITSVKTTLMQEWDGLRTTKDRVIVIASTNRPFDLDEAVLRRLPRRILVDLPDLHSRREILKACLQKNRVSAAVNMTKLAGELEGYSGSDIKEVCREAVVRIANERAALFEKEKVKGGSAYDDLNLSEPLREVCWSDFVAARKKLKASVSQHSRECEKMAEWNARYGEVRGQVGKPISGNPTPHMSMYI